MPTIKVRVENKRAIGDGVVIVCGNSDYIVHFDFDEEWDEFHVKTMVVRYGNEYQEVVFSGNEAELPIIERQNNIYIGVYAGDLHTTTSAKFKCLISIKCGLGTHEEPSEDVYNQIVELVESGILCGEGIFSVEQTTESTDDNGVNVWTLTTTEGRTFDFNVRNGSAGSAGEKGEKGEKGDKGDRGEPTDVEQTKGQSTTAVMSQKATTDAMNGGNPVKALVPTTVRILPANWRVCTDNSKLFEDENGVYVPFGVMLNIYYANYTQFFDKETYPANSFIMELDGVQYTGVQSVEYENSRNIYFVGETYQTSFVILLQRDRLKAWNRTGTDYTLTEVENEVSGASYYYDIVNAEITKNHNCEIRLNGSDLYTAKECALWDFGTISNGKIRVYCGIVPSTSLNIKYSGILTNVEYNKAKVDCKQNTSNDYTDNDKEKVESMDEEFSKKIVVSDALVKGVTGTESVTINGVSTIYNKLLNLQITGNSVQDGTPTTENPIPIENVGTIVTEGEHFGEYEFPIILRGKNLFDIDSFISAQGNSTYYSKDSNGNLVQIQPDYRSDGRYPASITLQAGTYYISPYTSKRKIYNSTLGYSLMTSTFSIQQTCEFAIKFWEDSGTVIKGVQIEEGSISTDFEPYQEPVTKIIYLEEPLRQGDTIEVVSGNLVRRRAVIYSYNGETVGDDWISTTGSLSIGATVEYGIEPIETNITGNTITTLDGTTIITVNTETSQSGISAKYNQSTSYALAERDSEIEELRNAIVALGGTI